MIETPLDLADGTEVEIIPLNQSDPICGSWHDDRSADEIIKDIRDARHSRDKKHLSMIYLLDTDTVIYWLKGNKNISHKVVERGFDTIAVSDITRAELYYGAFKSQKVDENCAAVKNIAERYTVACQPVEQAVHQAFRSGEEVAELVLSRY